MKKLTVSMCEHLQNVHEAKLLLSKEELSDVLELGDFVTFKELSAGDTVQYTKRPNSSYKVIRKYQNLDTARANLGDEFDELLSDDLIEELTTGATFVKSLPVCLVQLNDTEMIHIYAPDKFEDVDTLVAVK